MKFPIWRNLVTEIIFYPDRIPVSLGGGAKILDKT